MTEAPCTFVQGSKAARQPPKAPALVSDEPAAEELCKAEAAAPCNKPKLGNGKWEASMRSSWVLLGSGLCPSLITGPPASPLLDHSARIVVMAGLTEDMDKENLQALAQASGARVASEWNSSVTHVVCGVDSARTAKRTVKFMLGVLEARSHTRIMLAWHHF
eukprot:scaffold553052_cov36-Prasinocladus_malaysianus.AAC.1